MPLASSAKFTPLPAISEGTQVHQHIELVVDRSGSMKSFGSSIAPTLNEFISSQRQQAEQEIQELKTIIETLSEGDEKNSKLTELETLKNHTVSTINLTTFDNMVEQPWCTSEQSILPRITEAEVKPEDVKPRGMTALFDAMYNACNNISEMEKNKTCDFKGIVVTMTDGQENKSETTHATLTEKIKELTDKGITFMFLAANQDAITEAAKMGISKDNALNVGTTEENYGNAMRAVSGNIARTRTGDNAGFSGLERAASSTLRSVERSQTNPQEGNVLKRSPPAGLLRRQ